MEFHEKLQELRKRRGLTQEELAQALYVSRTAISKWESGRGYPNIDSLKEISCFFSVSIDALLSGEKLLSIAEKENRDNIQRICALLFSSADMLAFLLIVLPLYPDAVDGRVYSVNLPAYAGGTVMSRSAYWVLFLLLVTLGIGRMILEKWKPEKRHDMLTDISVGVHILTVLYLAVTRQAYATVSAFVLLVGKVMLLCKAARPDA